MYPIVRKEVLADQIVLMDIKAPMVARKCLPGQFIIAKTDEIGERIPLTICDYDREAGTITIVFQIVGASTEKMSHLKEAHVFLKDRLMFMKIFAEKTVLNLKKAQTL